MKRRGFLAQCAGGVGLVLAYGLFAGYAVAYLFPPRTRRAPRRLFIGRRSELAASSGRPFVDQNGRTLLIRATASGIEAFDTRCPHLGCNVHWEADKNRFLCPCHNGIFDAAGTAIAGPPFDAGQSLSRGQLDVDSSGNVFLVVEG